MSKYLPSMYREHPGLFRVSLASVLCHVLLAFDSLTDSAGTRHTNVGFDYLFAIFPPTVLGVLHTLSAVGLVVGLYLCKPLLKLSYLISAVVYSMTGCAFTIAYVLHPISLYGVAPMAFLTLVSIAGFIEPLKVLRPRSED